MKTSGHIHLTAAALLASCAITLAACGSGSGAGNPDSRLTLEQAKAPLAAGTPAPLAGLRGQANQLLPGGTDAFKARLAELDGHPVVVNKWASWCGPCRLEFPFFQAQATRRAGKVAFIGVDSNDSEAAAATFLTELPLPFPSYSDPDQKIAAEIDAPANFPSTSYYSADGTLIYTHAGLYATEEQLIADLDQYTD